MGKGCGTHSGQGSRLRAHSLSRKGEFRTPSALKPVYIALSWEENVNSCHRLVSPPLLPFTHALPCPGVISFIAILVVVVIILVGVVSLRFKCRKNKESEGKCLTLGASPCPSSLRDPELDTGTDTQPRVEGKNQHH